MIDGSSRYWMAGALAAGVLIALSGTVPTRAQELVGAEFGSGKVSSSIASLTDRPDVDDYSAVLMPGETLSVKVSAAKKSELRLDVVIVDPNGVDRTNDGVVKDKKNGAKVQIKSVPIDVVGRWTVLISGRDGTEGDYQAAFKIGAAKPIKIKKQTISGAPGAPDVRTHDVDAIAGGTIDLKLAWGKKDATVALLDLRGPDGTLSEIFGEDDQALRVKSTKVQLKKHPLDAGTGTHSIELGAEGTATYSLTLKLVAPPRISGKRSVISGNDPHLDTQDEPVRSAAGQPIRITGRNFALSPFPSVYFGPFEAEVVEVGAARSYIDAILPIGEDGAIQDLTVVNPDGQSAHHDDYVVYVPEAVVDSVAIVSGPVLGDAQVQSAGGTVFEVLGRHFTAEDVATLNGTILTKQGFSSTGFRLLLPAGDAGLVTFELTDPFGRVQSVADVARRVGFEESTTATLPAMSDDDDLSAWDGAIGDLDSDGRVDDMIIVTYNESSRVDLLYQPDPNNAYLGGVPVVGNSIGDREVYTRLFFRQPSGQLLDVTDSNLPGPGDDASGFDDLNALAVVVADINGDDIDDIVLGGSAGIGDTSEDFSRVRVLFNDGTGVFAHSGLVFDPIHIALLIAYDETYNPNAQEPTGIYNIAGERLPPRAVTALAVGDLDGDGDNEVIAGAHEFATRSIRYDPTPVDMSGSLPYINSGDVSLIDIDGRTYYYSATRIFDNGIADGNGMVDVTESALPGVGTEADPGHIAFRARHLLLGDIDDDDDLDLLVTWNNPASLIPESAETSFGSYPPYSYGVYKYVFDADSAQEVASTRVLLNDGDGVFTDATATWLPAPTGDEFWHAHRMSLADLDGDGDLDLILLHRRALNAYRYAGGVQPPAITRPSLRILRNDGSSFVDVTASAVPSEIVGMASRGRALAVGDIDLDGLPELVFGAAPDPDELDDLRPERNRQPPYTRVLWNRGNLVFELDAAFELPPSVDTGEVHALLIGDVDRDGLPAIHLLGEHVPNTSFGGALQRVHEWQR